VLVDAMGQTYLADPDVDGVEDTYAAAAVDGGYHLPHRIRASR
jgi:hypothetical protein